MAGQTNRAKWHPFFAALFDHAAAKPGAQLTHPWGHSVFGVAGKNFVFLGGPDDPGMTVKPYPGTRDVLISSQMATVAHYIGRFGWVDMRVKNRQQLKLALDLIDESYDHVIPKRARTLAAAAVAANSEGPRARTRRAPRSKARR